MSTRTPDELPRKIRLAWGLTDPGTRGPRRGLTLDQVLDAAIAVANDDGLEALSMSRVAKELGFTTMSLYRYVDSKDQLVELAWDRALGQPPALPTTGPWRPRLEAWALAEYRGLRASRWLTQRPIRTTPYWPNNMRWLNAGLGTLAETRLDEGTKVQLVLNVSLFVMSRARFSWELGAMVEDDLNYAAVMSKILDPEQYRWVLAAVEGGAFGPEDSGSDDAVPGETGVDWDDADFRFGLERLLEGIDVYIRRTEENR